MGGPSPPSSSSTSHPSSLAAPRFGITSDSRPHSETASASGSDLDPFAAPRHAPTPLETTGEDDERVDEDNAGAISQNAPLPAIDTLTSSAEGIPRVHIRTPSTLTPRTPRDAGLHIQTDGINNSPSLSQGLRAAGTTDNGKEQGEVEKAVPQSGSEPRQSALRSTLSAASMHSVYSLSPGSRISSPAINALPDITPLPSPLVGSDTSPIAIKTISRPGSAGSMSRSLRAGSLGSTGTGSPSKMTKKSYGNLKMSSGSGNTTSHTSNRSVSDFVPPALHNERPRTVTDSVQGTINDSALHREKYLAESRGMVQPPLPTPPPSNRSTSSVDEQQAREAAASSEEVAYMTIRSSNGRKRKYRAVRPLGTGTFSKVVLATSEPLSNTTKLDETSESWLQSRHLVAIKIVQHGREAGGGSAERVELGLRREIEILAKVREHPTLIHMRAFEIGETEALIALNYCPGGDLFDLASSHRDSLTPSIVRRITAELVDATRYLHSQFIVHRDIKLENVLLNIPAASLSSLPSTGDQLSDYPHPLITLTDLGLSRAIPQPPASPLLTTRCGSEDYAAPEILLGQPYDGRKTDAWAIGVLVYALMEGRLPFDAPPPRPGRRAQGANRTLHRIARCDWIWCEYGDDDGEWDAESEKCRPWEGLRGCVESLLKKVNRGRIGLDELATEEYIKGAITCSDGLRRPEHADDEVEED